MHSANFTALSRALSFVPAPVLVLRGLPALLAVAVLLAVPPSEAAFEPQPALTRPIRPANARATNGRGLLVMPAAHVARRPSSLVIAASLDRAWGRRTWEGNRSRWPPGAARSARVR